jgi:hypothetical protein
MSVNVDVDTLEVRRADDIVPAFGTLRSAAHHSTPYMCPDALACGSRGCGQSKEVLSEFCRSDQFMLPTEQFVRSISTGIFS